MVGLPRKTSDDISTNRRNESKTSAASAQIKTPQKKGASLQAPFKTNSYFVFFSVFVSAFFSVLASFASLASFSITAFSSW